MLWMRRFGCHYWWSNLSAWRAATIQLHMIKEAGALGVATSLTLPHHWLKATRASHLPPLRLHGCCHFLTLLFLPSLRRTQSVLFSYRKPQHEQRKEHEPKKPHIKKPLNAFMLYMKEMRANVVAECTLKESAAINQILGRRVGHINGAPRRWLAYSGTNSSLLITRDHKVRL